MTSVTDYELSLRRGASEHEMRRSLAMDEMAFSKQRYDFEQFVFTQQQKENAMQDEEKDDQTEVSGDAPITMIDEDESNDTTDDQSEAMDEKLDGEPPSIAQKPPEFRNEWHRAHYEMTGQDTDQSELFGQYCGMAPGAAGEELLTMHLQAGPIKEVGLHGLQIDDILLFARHVLSRLNKHPYNNLHNSRAIVLLDQAIAELAARTAERKAAGKEGTSTP